MVKSDSLEACWKLSLEILECFRLDFQPFCDANQTTMLGLVWYIQSSNSCTFLLKGSVERKLDVGTARFQSIVNIILGKHSLDFRTILLTICFLWLAARSQVVLTKKVCALGRRLNDHFVKSW